MTLYYPDGSSSKFHFEYDFVNLGIVTCSSHRAQLQSSNAGATLIQNMQKEKVAPPLQDNDVTFG